jgi:adenylate cyclase class IV
MSHHYEVEIKTLLWSKESADDFLENLENAVEKLEKTWENSQLNHYFQSGDAQKLVLEMQWDIPNEKIESMRHICTLPGKHSFRTRFVDGNSILVIKLSVDETSSSNGIQRMEWEHIFEDVSLEELDRKLLESGFEYQAKWSRERVEYRFDNINVCIDKNAGYGYLAEFEMLIANPSETQMAEENIRGIMARVWVQELDQARLERMFAYYNQNWRDYYGTEKTFTIE